MAERSKALVLGTSLFGGVGSNPTAASYFKHFQTLDFKVVLHKITAQVKTAEKLQAGLSRRLDRHLDVACHTFPSTIEEANV